MVAVAREDAGRQRPRGSGAHRPGFINWQATIQREFLLQYAREVGLDMKRFEQALDSAKGKPRIDADIAEANSLGTTGTPAFFINGRFLNGAKPFAEFAKVINAELDRLKIDIPLAARKPS